ncbi:DEAD/DEAH box helicase [uncultured Brevibacterium sp.]|uniref:DEAD/DEAH box helicase n=1 Tax=uncultured Brevibacterium sp. TaxID=189678 RepID=UPI0025FC06D1|nr:DEAD/DEAH box helicase [uncultured Brevibacterium sp.]
MSDSRSALLDLIGDFGAREDRIRHIEHFPARVGTTADWPEWADDEVVAALRSTGIDRPWTHQVAAADAAHRGEDVVIASGTASGKSLGFWLPVLDSVVRTRDEIPTRAATTLYLSPTKALAADQYEKLRSVVLRGLRPGTFDGDTSQANKAWARKHANVLFTNPDMLHRSVLPRHGYFTRWFKTLRFIVVDEAHRYRGVFGSHVALILRRLVRVARHYGADPVIVGASATMADPAAAFARITGREAIAITEDASPRAAGDFVLWEPPLLPEPWGLEWEDPDPAVVGGPGHDPFADSRGPSARESAFTPVPGPAPGTDQERAQEPTGTDASRRSTIAESADILTDLTCAGFRSIAFIASRRGTEALAEAVRDQVARVDSTLPRTVAAYRGGYLPEERRLLETGLRNGRLRTVASTNALELGIDIAGLDAVVMAGWPGTLASLWQQAGRAGRAGQQWAAVLIARDNPLDTYVVNHPEAVFGAPVDGGVIDPGNPFVLAGHLCAAAAEIPLTEADLPQFGDTAEQVLASLAEARMLRRRPAGWFWAKAEDAAALTDIRGSGGGQVRIVEESTGTLLGTIEDAGAHTQSHTGAVYMHQGRTFTVRELDLDARVAFVEAANVDYSTQAKSVTEISIESTDHSITLPSGARVFTGMVEVVDQVVAYQMRQQRTGVVLAEHPLELPERTLRTQAVWFTAPPELLADAEVERADVPGTVHAAEHAAIGLLPLFAGCDRWDVGGVSTAMHADTGMTTVFVYDGQPGGAGFAERGFDCFTDWHRATLEAIESCECISGCPSCIQSPKCGNGNEPLDKAGAVRILRALLG